MKGFSLTTIVLEESIEKALLDVETASWQKPVQPRTINVVPSTLDSAGWILRPRPTHRWAITWHR